MTDTITKRGSRTVAWRRLAKGPSLPNVGMSLKKRYRGMQLIYNPRLQFQAVVTSVNDCDNLDYPGLYRENEAS